MQFSAYISGKYFPANKQIVDFLFRIEIKKNDPEGR